MTTHTHI